MKRPFLFFAAILTVCSTAFGQRIFDAKEQLDSVWEKTIEIIRFSGTEEDIVETFGHFKNCKRANHIIIQSEDIEKIPIGIFKFPRLARLEFIGCDNLDFSTVLQQIRHNRSDIVSVLFRNMDFSNSVFDRDQALEYLEELSFYGCTGINNRLEELMNFLKTDDPVFKHFKYLRLDSCGIQSSQLPSNFKNLEKLVSLSLRENQLISVDVPLPENLWQLDISFNAMEIFPFKSIDTLDHLRFLSVDCNNLGRDEIMQVCNLKKVSKNKNDDGTPKARCKGKHKLKSYTYSCNDFDDQEGIQTIAKQLDCYVTWRTGMGLPINDFRPEPIDCEACMHFKHKKNLIGTWKVIAAEVQDRSTVVETWKFGENQVYVNTTRDVPYANLPFDYHLEEMSNSDKLLTLEMVGSSQAEIVLRFADNTLKLWIPEDEQVLGLTLERDAGSANR